MKAEAKGVAAFDFDGTLTRQDTMMPFLPRAHGWPRVVGAALLSTPKACVYSARPPRPHVAVLQRVPNEQSWAVRTRTQAAHRLRTLQDGFRDGLKVATVGRLFKGMSQTELEELGSAYAETIHELLRPEMLDRVRWHRDEGHATVIVSASLAVYLRPIAEELGIHDVLGVELAADGDGRLTGHVDGGANNRGPHKVARLRDWLDTRFGAGTPLELWAYGDSSGDDDLLAMADHPTWVGKRGSS